MDNSAPFDGADDYHQRMGDDVETGVADSAESVEAAAATELAGVAEADTMSAYAWSLDEPDVYEDERQWPYWVTTAAVAAAAGLVTMAGVLAYVHLVRDRSHSVAAQAATTTSPAVTPKAAPRPLPPPPPVTVTTVVVESKVAAPPPPPPLPAPLMSRWSYDVRWFGAPGITVIEHAGGQSQPRYVGPGDNLGMGTGWTGEVIGADPIISGSITWAECTLYIDGVLAKQDQASVGDGHDVSCLMRLTR